MKISKWLGLVILFNIFCSPSFADTALVSQLSEIKETAGRSKEETKLVELLEKSLASYDSLKNYKAIFHKTERSGDVVGMAEEIFLKFEKPFKIYMGWLNTYKKGLQVVYERGKHGNKLAIHKPGLLLGLAPVVFLDQSSPWVQEGGSTSYDIEDAGIGNFLTEFTKAVIRGAKEGKLKVLFQGKENANGLAGERVHVTFENSQKDEDYFAYRIEVLFDEKHQLPVAMELFDSQNQTIGVYEYHDLRVDVDKDAEFENQINRSLLKVYKGKSQPRETPHQTQNFARSQKA